MRHLTSLRAIRRAGFTLIELLVAIAIAALLLAAMSGLVGTALETQSSTGSQASALQDARFAMQRMVTAVRGTNRLLLPLADNPATTWRENVREQTIPASAPEGDSTLATAVLAVTLDPTLDVDEDGVADADNDGDGRIDEDQSRDSSNDGASGLIGIDDDGDGSVDESSQDDDDEDGSSDEDWIDGVDDDGDGSVDEDTNRDMNNDGKPGLSNVDDDGDGDIDEGNQDDDDEDGSDDEDWLDTVVFYLVGNDLVERRPNPNPADGTDFAEYVIAENVAGFRVERRPDAGRRSILLDLTLELTAEDGGSVDLQVRVRVGGGS